MSDAVSRLAASIVQLRTRVDGLGAGPQLAYSSIENGAIGEHDANGKLVAVIGKQFDGSHGAYAVSGPTPPRPTAPSAVGGTSATLGWDGFFLNLEGQVEPLITAPMDWSRVELHISQEKGFRADTAATLVDTIETPRGGSRPVLPEPGIWYAVLVARSLAGKRGEQSPETEFEIVPGLTEEDVQELRDEFGEMALDLNRALQENAASQAQLGQQMDTLQGTTLPALEQELDAAQGRLDSADQLLNVTFPKRISDAEGVASAASTKAGAAETKATAAETKAAAAQAAAAQAAADLVTAKNRADTAAAAATKAATDAAAAEASSTRATGAAGVAEAAADEARQDAAAALTQAQNAGDDVELAREAATTAQTAANTAKTQATAAGTSAAAADAKAAQAAADAAKATADAAAAKASATTAATEATTAKTAATTATSKATAAETAAATAKTRADTAAADATAAASRATAAESSATRATGAAGVAEAAADEARQDAAAALTQAQNSGTNATAAQTAATAAQTAANTAKTQATAAGTSAAAADAAAAQAAADAARAAADLVVARNAAADARGDADTALGRADSAITMAGSAARILYSTADPSGTAREGDTWRKTANDSGDVIAEWRYTKVGTAAASWKPQKVTSDMVSNLDIGKLSAGTGTFIQAVADKMAAATATIQKADIGNLTVTGTSQLADAVAQKMSAKIGEFIDLSTDRLVAGSASISTGVADKFFADIFATRKLSAQQVFIGAGGNLLVDPAFQDPQLNTARQAVSPGTWSRIAGTATEPAFMRHSLTNSNGVFHYSTAVPTTARPGTEMVSVKPGQKFQLSVSVTTTTTATCRWNAYLKKADGAVSLVALTSQSGNGRRVLQQEYTIPTGVVAIAFAVSCLTNGTTFTVHGDGSVTEKVTPSLIVDGFFQGLRVIGASVETNSAANRGIKMTDAGLFAYSNTGAETLRFDGANSIITGATMRTSASGARVQLDALGLTAWNAANAEIFKIAGGSVSMQGALTASGTTEGSATQPPIPISLHMGPSVPLYQGGQPTSYVVPGLQWVTPGTNMLAPPQIYSTSGQGLTIQSGVDGASDYSTLFMYSGRSTLNSSYDIALRSLKGEITFHATQGVKFLSKVDFISSEQVQQRTFTGGPATVLNNLPWGPGFLTVREDMNAPFITSPSNDLIRLGEAGVYTISTVIDTGTPGANGAFATMRIGTSDNGEFVAGAAKAGGAWEFMIPAVTRWYDAGTVLKFRFQHNTGADQTWSSKITVVKLV